MNINSYKYQKIFDNSELEDGHDSQSTARSNDTYHSAKSRIEKSKVISLPRKSIYPTPKSKWELKLNQKVLLDNIIFFCQLKRSFNMPLFWVLEYHC